MLYFYQQHTIAITASLTVQRSGEGKLFMYSVSPLHHKNEKGRAEYTTVHSIAYVTNHKKMLCHNIGYVKTANIILCEL
jgi:hypothetical protein